MGRPLVSEFLLLVVGSWRLLFLLLGWPGILLAFDSDQKLVLTSVNGHSVEVIRIPAETGDGLQFAEGAFWFTRNSFWGNAKTFRMDAESHTITTFKRPYQPGPADLLVAGGSAWFSESPLSGIGVPGRKGKGDLWRFSLEANREEGRFASAGTPFDQSGGILWAFNPWTQAITGIDMASNSVATQWSVGGRGPKFRESLAWANGSIWLSTYAGEGSWTGNLWALDYTHIQRMDPESHDVLASIPLGPFHALSRLSPAAGDLWLMGHRDLKSATPTPVLLRIDPETNTIVKEISLEARGYLRGSDPILVRNIVCFDGFIWVIVPSNSSSIYFHTRLIKIDPETTEIIDRFDIEDAYSDRLLVADGSLWIGFGKSLWKIVPPMASKPLTCSGDGTDK